MRTRDEFDMLLEAPNPTAARIARSILEEAGIPSLLLGEDGDMVPGMDWDILAMRADLLVPRGTKQRALDLLAAAGFFGGGEEPGGDS